MKLTTTLNRIRECGPCKEGWKILLKSLGGDFDPDTEINLLIILESNGVADMLWALRSTIQDSKRIASQLAIEFAEQALPVFEQRKPGDLRPRKAIQAARDYLDGAISLEGLWAAKSAADVAAAAYADSAADAAADAAAYAAAAAAAYAAADAAAAAAAYAAYAADSAAADSAYAADARGKAREKQAEIIRSILE